MTIKIHFFVNLNNDHQGRQHSSSSTDGLFLGLLTQQKLLLFHLRNTQSSLYVLNKMIKLSRGRFVSSFRVPSPFFPNTLRAKFRHTLRQLCLLSVMKRRFCGFIILILWRVRRRVKEENKLNLELLGISI